MNEDDTHSPEAITKNLEKVQRILRKHDPMDMCVDLASQSIHIISDELYKMHNIENLYLECNHLQELPDDFFDNLPNLKWLDLRNNDLADLPATIGRHKNLRNLLLEKNRITHLPLELGNVHTITGISLGGNPLEVPSPYIVEQGVQAILSYLLQALNNVTGQGEQIETNFSEEFDFARLLHRCSDGDGIKVRQSEDGIKAPQSEDEELDMVLRGPTSRASRFHQPRPRTKNSDSMRRRVEASRESSRYVKSRPARFENAVDVLMDETNERLQNELQNRERDMDVLDEWREEAKRLQQKLLPKLNTVVNNVAHLPGEDRSISETQPLTEEKRGVRADVVEQVERIEPDIEIPRPGKTDEDVLNEQLSAKLDEIVIGESDLDSESVVSGHEQKQSSPCQFQVEDGDKLENTGRDHPYKPAGVREKLDSEVRARMRQHTSHLRFREKRDSNKILMQQGRELLDQKMEQEDNGLEYRFRAFTGDSSSYTSSNKT